MEPILTRASDTVYKGVLILGLIVVTAVVTWRVLLVFQDAPPSATEPFDSMEGEEATTIAVFESAAPSVVNITSIAVRRNAYTMRLSEIPQGSGSGFVWDNKGHIVTNYHVLQNAQEALVTLADQTTYRAKVVGQAPHKDLAVLRLDGEVSSLKPIPVGRSEGLRVGQAVYAIGNPFGLDHTLTTGVISGLNREIESVTKRPIQGVVQTDAAINPGNSGGPLLDRRGRLIGVNTQILSPSGAYAGVGFAVPADTVNRIVPQLIQYGEPLRPGLGIKLLPDGVVQRRNLQGVLFWSVLPGSAASEAGLQPSGRDVFGRFVAGDRIVGIESADIATSSDLFRALENHKVGESVRVTVVRKRKKQVIRVTLQRL